MNQQSTSSATNLHRPKPRGSSFRFQAERTLSISKLELYKLQLHCDVAIEEIEKERTRLAELPPSQETRIMRKMQHRLSIHFRQMKIKINEAQFRLNLVTTDGGDYKNNTFVENDNIDNDYAEDSHGPEVNYEHLELLMYEDRDSSD